LSHQQTSRAAVSGKGFMYKTDSMGRRRVWNWTSRDIEIDDRVAERMVAESPPAVSFKGYRPDPTNVPCT
jgi:hypothetical protein